VRTSRRYELRLPSSLSSDLEDFAQRSELGWGPSIRLLIRRGLELEARSRRAVLASDSPAALAALTAAEHAVLMVASILPEGEQRIRALAERASQAAESRLATFTEPEAGEV